MSRITLSQIPTLKKIGTAWVGGDMTGDTRGANAIDIQSNRSAITQVAGGASSSAFGNLNTSSGNRSSAFGYRNVASGNYSTSIGYSNTASDYNSSALGFQNTASGYSSSAVGYSNTSSAYSSSALGYGNTSTGQYSSAIGYTNSASGDGSSAIGVGNIASGANSSAIGFSVETTVANTQEFGYWSGPTIRSGAIRIHGTGMVATTIQEASSAYTASAELNGSEADNTLATSMYAIRRNGNDLYLDINIAGTVKTISLGTAV